MKNIIKIIGKGKPAVAVVGCVHGDEIIGKKIIENLKDTKLKKGSLALIIAHPQALKKRKRFLEKDLNRCFHGRKNGLMEERLAYKLHKILKDYDLIIDIHATNSSFESLAVVTKLDIKIKKLLRYVPIKTVALICKKVFGGNEMIAYCKVGISLDYGPDKTGKNYKTALSHIKILLKNLGMLPGKKSAFRQKELYKISGIYKVPKNFEPNKNLKEFCFIKKGQVIGQSNKKAIKAQQCFYPLFLGKGRYEKSLALMASREKISL